MQSKISCFNGSVFRKTVSRFWPVWGAYLAVGILALPFVILANRYSYHLDPDRLSRYLLNFGHFGGLAMSAVFALFSAMAVWSFLFSTRAAHGMACLPLRRESVFFSAMLGGLIPLLAANLIVYLFAAASAAVIGAPDFCHAADGFAIASLQMLLFYGFATFCAFLTGNILALPAAYVGLNFVFVGMETLVRFILRMFVYGLNGNVGTMSLRWLSPVVAIAMDCACYSDGEWRDGEYILLEPARFSGWGVLLVYAAVGLLFLALALMLCRRRKMETAGDVVAIGILKPIFRWCMAIGCAVVLSCGLCVLFLETPLGDHNPSQTAALLCMIGFMLIGAFIGWFVGEMLLKKSFRVFRGRWGGLCVCWLIIAALMLACEFDLFGYERYVPQSDKVEAVSVMANGERAALNEQENIAAVCALQRQIIAEKAANEAAEEDYDAGGRSVNLRIDYDMAGGRAVSREYTLRYTEGDTASYGAAAEAQELLNCTEAIHSRKETAIPVTTDTVTYGSATVEMTAAECAAAADYPTAQDYVLALMGVTEREADTMSSSEIRQLLIEAVNTISCYHGRYADGKYYDDDAVYGEAEVTASDFPVEPELQGWTPETGCPLEDVIFEYAYTLTPAEAVSLYYDCLVPDMEDGTLGRIWIITDEEYAQTVCAASIWFQLSVNGDNVRYGSFYTVPTVNSVRTDAWLAANGAVLHTEAEVNG